MMNPLFPWLQTNLWQTAFVSLLFLLVCCPFFLIRHRVRFMLRQVVHWQELEHSIQELGKEEIRFYPNPTRHVLASVLANRKGTARAGAVGPALEYLAAAVDSPVRTLRSLSYLAVLIGLLGTVTMLAMALQRVDTIGQFKADLLKNIYPINAFAIGLAVAVYLSYSWYRYKADQFLLISARVLGRLRADQLGGADPVLLATLEKVGEKFTEWGDEIHARYLAKIDHLLQELRELHESVLQIVTEAVAGRQEEDQALVPLLRSQDAKIELLAQMVYQGQARLASGEEAQGGWEPSDPGVGEKIRAAGQSPEEQNPPKAGFFRRYFRGGKIR